MADRFGIVDTRDRHPRPHQRMRQRHRGQVPPADQPDTTMPPGAAPRAGRCPVRSSIPARIDVDLVHGPPARRVADQRDVDAMHDRALGDDGGTASRPAPTSSRRRQPAASCRCPSPSKKSMRLSLARASPQVGMPGKATLAARRTPLPTRDRLDTAGTATPC